MINQLFTTLTRAVDSLSAVSLAAAFAWGVLSVILSPCHIASIPLIVGFIDQQGRTLAKRAFAVSLCFSTGILLSIALLGVITAGFGMMLGDLGPAANYFVAGVFFLFGLILLDVIRMPFGGFGQINLKLKGLFAAFVLGLVFGIALGPCTFAYMAPILAVTFKLAGTQPVFSGALLLLYGVGHCSVIVFAGTCTELVQEYMNWDRQSSATVVIKRICGGLIILLGLYLIANT